MFQNRCASLSVLLMMAFVSAPVRGDQPLGSAFAYQGQLKWQGAPLDGAADFRFSAWSEPSGGQQIGTEYQINGVGGPLVEFRGESDFGGGLFEDTDDSGWAKIGWGSSKVYGNGSVSFVQSHPYDRNHTIVYTAPEGDEAATYTRGTARLVNGEARVALGETFQWVTNPDIGLTAHLTPRGDCEGLYVDELTTAEMVVRELRGGGSNVVFDYMVYGLRVGFEEVAVVQQKQREAPIPSMAAHRAEYEKEPQLRAFNSLERFKRMRAGIGETRPLDLAAAAALREAIANVDRAQPELTPP